MPDATLRPDHPGAEEPQNIKCSFCRKSSLEVKALISAPGGIYICDKCVDECAEIIKSYREAHDN